MFRLYAKFVVSCQLKIIKGVSTVNISHNVAYIEPHYSVFVSKRMQPEVRNEVIPCTTEM